MANKKGSLRIYKEEYPSEMYKMLSSGALNCEIIAKWKIDADTFYEWVNEVEEFGLAYKAGISAKQAWWVKRGREMMEGKRRGNDKIWKKFIECVCEDFKPQAEQTGTINNISISNMNVLQQKSPEALTKYILDMSNRHSDAIEVSFIDRKDSSESEGSA